MIEAIAASAGGQKFLILQIDAHIDWRETHAR
jgi:agmatinase